MIHRWWEERPKRRRVNPLAHKGRRARELRISFGCFLIIACVTYSAAATEAPPGANACSGCHASNAAVGTQVPSLIGRKPDEIIAALAAFKNGQRPATVMDRIAKGFSDDEIRAIAEWYGTKRK
jgi:cytochrome c553